MESPSTTKLYKVWHVGKMTYPLCHVLSVLNVTREYVIGTDLEKLVDYCEYRNRTRDDDEHFEIRAVANECFYKSDYNP